MILKASQNILLIGFVFLFISSCNAKLLQSNKKGVNYLLNEHVKATGGKKLLNGVKSFYTIIHYNDMIIKSSYIRGQKYRQDVVDENSTITTIYTTSQAVRCGNGELTNLTPIEVLNYKEDSFIFQLFKAKQRGWEFSLDPSRKEDSENYYIIGLNTQSKQKMMYALSKKTFLINKVENGFGQIIEYYDYKKFSGLIYPTRFRLSEGDFSTNFKVEKVILNKDFDKHTFNIDVVCN